MPTMIATGLATFGIILIIKHTALKSIITYIVLKMSAVSKMIPCLGCPDQINISSGCKYRSISLVAKLFICLCAPAVSHRIYYKI